jgi:hypothetical protein
MPMMITMVMMPMMITMVMIVIMIVMKCFNKSFSNFKHTVVFTDYRLICTGLASFMSKLFIGPSESLRNLKVFILLWLYF